MAKKMINKEHIEGRVYEHSLALKTSKSEKTKGTQYIGGNLRIATDEAGLNVVEVHFTFVTEMTKAGGKNNTFTALKKIMDEGKYWVTDGKDAATKVKVDTNLGVNDFYAQDDTLVSVKVNEGGFVTVLDEFTELAPEEQRNTFNVDMFINKVTRKEADPENNIPEDYVTVRGAVFNFRNDLLPVDFVIRNPSGMNYFETLDLPCLTKVWGRINSTTVTIERTEESAFGEAAVKTYERKTKEWLITGAAKVPYDYGDETVLTDEEVEKALQDRQVRLAEIKKNRDDYNASRVSAQANAFSAGAMNAPIPNQAFNF